MTSILILQHQRPDGEVDTYHLKAGRRYHLGRGSQCQVRVLDLKLSRQHCAFEHGDQGWLLVDLASTNGCAVDGERVNGSRPLRSGGGGQRRQHHGDGRQHRRFGRPRSDRAGQRAPRRGDGAQPRTPAAISKRNPSPRRAGPTSPIR